MLIRKRRSRGYPALPGRSGYEGIAIPWPVRKHAVGLLIFALSLFYAGWSCAQTSAPGSYSAQILGTVHDERGRWNLFLERNNMDFDPESGGFVRAFKLATTGGRNGDGIYAIRFTTNHDLSEVYKRSAANRNGPLITGTAADQGENIIFQVLRDGEYTIFFDPGKKTYSIVPNVEMLTTIETVQLNGFIYDNEGSEEWSDSRRTYPAPKWDETRSTHDMTANADGSWSKTLFLSAAGGHEKNGVYQCLFSINHNGDWGLGGINGWPGRLRGGSGYGSKNGTVGDSAVVFKVEQDGEHTITVHPETFRWEITPPATILNRMESFQVNGPVVDDSWNPKAPGHQMVRSTDGTWKKSVNLSNSGGPGGDGVYSLNFTIGEEWVLDGIGMGGDWGKTWHALPQETNILFRVLTSGTYEISLDPENNTFGISPPVLPITGMYSLELVGDFEEFAGDGQDGWNPYHPVHAMQAEGQNVFSRELKLTGNRVYHYKYTGNRAGWLLSFSDYPYDGRRELSAHGDPEPLTFTPQASGTYRFTADMLTGEYTIDLVATEEANP